MPPAAARTGGAYADGAWGELTTDRNWAEVWGRWRADEVGGVLCQCNSAGPGRLIVPSAAVGTVKAVRRCLDPAWMSVKVN